MSDRNVQRIALEQEMRLSFLDYSMSVIVSRALPDVRDGLKPVHRRILYAMYGLKNFHNKPYLKSARIVGDVIGKYHPHGDTAVYDALVRMAQDFSLRHPLVDGQGNFGSVDGDSAAAMRYTESRMSAIAGTLLADIEMDTVDFVPNYDNKDVEPVVLPAVLPQLLVNGASGIAVGMATNIPPHNLGEIIAAAQMVVRDEATSIETLCDVVQGPDFPTRGEIHGVSGIREAYLTGRGQVVMRARAEVEEYGKGRERVIVSEIPFQVNKARLIEKIAELVRAKRIEGISDLRDESAKDEIRIVIELRAGESAQVILNQLYKMTPLQSGFGVNMVALVDGRPRLLNLRDILREFARHRRRVVERRTRFQLRKLREREHLLAGLRVAVENIDAVVELIRAARSTEHAAAELRQHFSLSELQAKAILEMRLARLSAMEREKIVREYAEVQQEIGQCEAILGSADKIRDIVLAELADLGERFATPRRTTIVPLDAEEFSVEQLVADDRVSVTITQAGYVKRTPLSEIAAQRRGGKGRAGVLMKEEDLVLDVFATSNHATLLCFTNLGRVFSLRAYQLPEAGLRTRGKHFSNILSLQAGERVVSVLPTSGGGGEAFVFSVTRAGYIKKTELASFERVRVSGVRGLRLDEGDELVTCRLCLGGEADVFLATALGQSIRFRQQDVRPMGRVSRGVGGIDLEAGDAVIAMEIVEASEFESPHAALMTVCENGFGKLTPLAEYRRQTRNGKGSKTILVNERNGHVVGVMMIRPEEDVIAVTNRGKVMRFPARDVRVSSRRTQGVCLMRVSDHEKVIAVSRLEQDEDRES